MTGVTYLLIVIFLLRYAYHCDAGSIHTSYCACPANVIRYAFMHILCGAGNVVSIYCVCPHQIVVRDSGPVGPGDMVGGANVSLIMSTCRAGDGLLLKPDRPATTMDAVFTSAVFTFAPPGTRGDVHVDHLTSTYATLTDPASSATYRWHYIHATAIQHNHMINWSDLGHAFNATAHSVVDWFHLGGAGTLINASSAGFTIVTGQGQPGAPANALPTR